MRMLLAVAAASLAATAANAADDLPLSSRVSGDHWSIVTGETVSPNRDALSFELGWPGVGIGYIHGLSDRADVGLKFDLLYGAEGTSNTRIGMGLHVPLRIVASRRDKLSIELHVDPGVRFYGSKNDSGSDFVIGFPVGVVLGIQATPEFRIGAGFDLNMAVIATHGGYFEVAPLFGISAEYFVDKQLLVGLNTRFGPQFYSVGGDAEFSFRTQVVVGYRL